MNIRKGQKCRYLVFPGIWENGEILCVEDNGRFTVYKDTACIAQYNDTVREYSKEDIGIKVIITN